MLDVRHFYKFSISAERQTIPYTSEFTGSYGYFEYEFGVDEFFNLLYGNSFCGGRIRPFKVNRSG
jgi:hypothetical protein